MRECGRYEDDWDEDAEELGENETQEDIDEINQEMTELGEWLTDIAQNARDDIEVKTGLKHIVKNFTQREGTSYFAGQEPKIWNHIYAHALKQVIENTDPQNRLVWQSILEESVKVGVEAQN